MCHYLEIWEPEPPGSVRDNTGLYLYHNMKGAQDSVGCISDLLWVGQPRV